MMGPIADEKSMKPTILIVCDRQKVKGMEKSLKDFIRIAFPDVDFKAIPGSVTLASGALSGLPSEPGDRSNALVFTLSDGGGFPFVGIATRREVLHREYKCEITVFETFTIGGMISIGSSIYGLTVAHSVRGGRTQVIEIDPGTRLSDLDAITDFYGSLCGRVEFYEWSGDEDTELAALSTSTPEEQKPAVAMDWMLVHLYDNYITSNTFKSPDSKLQQDVTGFLRLTELRDGEMWIFSKHPQMGILDSTPSTIILGQISYEVLSIALEFPLGRLCGCL